MGATQSSGINLKHVPLLVESARAHGDGSGMAAHLVAPDITAFRCFTACSSALIGTDGDDHFVSEEFVLRKSQACLEEYAD